MDVTWVGAAAKTECCELRVINKNFNVGDDAEFCPKQISSWPCFKYQDSDQDKCCDNKLMYGKISGDLWCNNHLSLCDTFGTRSEYVLCANYKITNNITDNTVNSSACRYHEDDEERKGCCKYKPSNGVNVNDDTWCRENVPCADLFTPETGNFTRCCDERKNMKSSWMCT